MPFSRLLNMSLIATTTLSFNACGIVELIKIKPDEYKFSNKVDAQTVFNGSKVSCEDGCPQYVGGLVTYTEGRNSYIVSVCSLTLIDDNLILTNRHCLPDDLQYKGASCAGRIRVKLPATNGFRSEDFECNRVEAQAS